MGIELKEIYDGFAATYDENRGLFDMTGVFEAFYHSLGQEKGHLLDLGCGAGEPMARFFIDHGWQVTGVDFSEKMLKLAARYVPEMTPIFEDMRMIDFSKNTFDGLTAIYSIFHLPVHDQEKLFRQIHKWLRPEGKALFTYGTKEYTGFDEFEGYKKFMGQELFYAHTTPEKLTDFLESIGFDILSKDYREIGGETFLWVTMEKRSVG
ncbi:MAG: class I SAM-dependent methyltransferase [Candidatus Marinimicrobia bacterium]|nr:class I SAM-dependent methyltransferase [Candidatus Neomarinimicrobiota bacterium]